MGLARLLLVSLPCLSLASAETVLGIYVFSRHGDRTTKSWKPVSLTALGADNMYKSGSYFRSRYIEANGSSAIYGIAQDVPTLSQLSFTSPVDNTLQASANYFTQGLYPPAGTSSDQTLANGTEVETPLGGYQYIPINAVNSAASSSGSETTNWLQGSSACPNAQVSSNNYFASQEYLDTLASTADFYQSLLPVYSSTFSTSTANFENAYTIWDYVHVATIHNASSTIPSDSLLTNETLLQLQTRGDQHEFGLAFNSSDNARSVSGAVLAAQVLDALNTTLLGAPSNSSLQRMTVQFGVYSAFMSYFGLAQALDVNPDFYGVCDYGSAMVWELVTNATVDNTTTTAVDPSQVSVRFLVVNGTASSTNELQAYPLFGQAETVLPWDTFASNMSAFAVGSSSQWCAVCGESATGCSTAASSSSTASSSSSSSPTASTQSGNGLSKVDTGVIGAMVTLVTIALVGLVLMRVLGLKLVKASSLAKSGDAAKSGSPPA